LILNLTRCFQIGALAEGCVSDGGDLMDRFLKKLFAKEEKPPQKEQAGAAESMEELHAFHRAVGSRDIGQVSSFLSQGFDVNQRNAQGHSAIHVAAGLSREILEMLINAGADIEAITKEGRTPLMEAALLRQKDTVQLLLGHGASLDRKDIRGSTASDLAKSVNDYGIAALIEEERHIRKKERDGIPREKLCAARDALIGNNVEAVRKLLEEGLDMRDLTIERYYPPAHLAARKGYLELLKLLLSVYGDINAKDESGATMLFGATACRQREIVRYLLDEGADNGNCADVGSYTLSSRTPLSIAIDRFAAEKDSRDEYSAIIRMLAESGAELYPPDLSYLGRAAPFMPADVMSMLKTRVRLPDKGSGAEDALHNAVSSGNPEMVKLVLGRGCNVNAPDRQGRTPLFYAPGKEVASLLIESGASPDVRDSKGLTPLHEARDAGVAAVLIDRGIDVNAVSNEGLTPLHCARSAGIALLLLQRGASIEAGDSYGSTPLFRVNTDAAAALLDRGADINAVNSFGDTALHDTAISGSLDKAELLVNRGAGINIVNKKGETPYDKSQYESDNEWKWKSRDRVGQFLQSRGGREGRRESR